MVLGVLDCRTSDAVRQWFHTAIVSVFGTPALVRTDQGSEFKGDFAAFCSEADITHVVIPTESPWSNGVAERLVRSVKSFLKHLAVTEGEGDWPSMLPNI